MGSKRFSKLLQLLSFDDIDTREERRRGDKFCHLRDIFMEVDGNLRSHFKPSECLTLDESLVRFRGRCPFRMYMPSKPGKYDLLLRTVADANYRYMWKIWSYSGRPTVPELAPPATYFESIPEMVKSVHGGRCRWNWPQYHHGPVLYVGATRRGPDGRPTDHRRHL